MQNGRKHRLKTIILKNREMEMKITVDFILGIVLGCAFGVIGTGLLVEYVKRRYGGD